MTILMMVIINEKKKTPKKIKKIITIRKRAIMNILSVASRDEPKRRRSGSIQPIV